MSKWLVKTEPESYSVHDFVRDKVTCWDGVRNYQARNYLIAMKKGDEVLVYHSSADPTGVAGVAKVVKEAYPEPAQFDPKSKYFDPGSTMDNPRWMAPDLKLVRAFRSIVTLDELRAEKRLEKLVVLRRGNRLSVTPVSDAEFEVITKLAG